MNRQVILALFDTTADEEALSPLLADLPGLISLCAPPRGEELSAALARLGLDPLLVILSSRLYPETRPELVAVLRAIYPSSEILVLTLERDPFPPLRRIADDRVRHLLVTPDGYGEEELSSLKGVIGRLLAGARWRPGECVRPGHPVHEFPLHSSLQKETIIAAVEQAVSGDSAESELLRQRAALLADEMIENALYGAPRGESGGKLYRKGEERAIDSGERIVFRFAFDGETLAMEIVDGWGTLAPEMVVDFLSRNQEGISAEEGGGRGLFIIWRFLDHLHVSISPGRQTVLGGHIRAGLPFDYDAPRGFSISTEFACP